MALLVRFYWHDLSDATGILQRFCWHHFTVVCTKMRITDFTMSIQGYEVGKNGLYNNETIEIGKNQVIYIFDCEYDKENGFRMKKNIKSEKECEEDNFI